MIIAHRGASAIAPENTLLAISRAIELGADMVEVDVQLTQDRRPVIFHDWHCGRVVRAEGYSRRALRRIAIADITAGELLRFDVGAWRGRGFAGQGIPSLETVLTACRGRIGVNLELKVPDGASRAYRAELVDAVARTLGEAGMTEMALLSSFDRAILQVARTVLPRTPRGVLPQPGGLAETVQLADRFDARSVHLRSSDIRRGTVKIIHDLGRQVYAYTVDRPATMRRLLQYGVDGIFTNEPDTLARLLGRVHA